MVIFGLAQEPSVGADDDRVETIEQLAYIEYSVLGTRQSPVWEENRDGWLIFFFVLFCVGCLRASFQTRLLDVDVFFLKVWNRCREIWRS